jgi:hypothetical protein
LFFSSFLLVRVASGLLHLLHAHAECQDSWMGGITRGFERSVRESGAECISSIFVGRRGEKRNEGTLPERKLLPSWLLPNGRVF